MIEITSATQLASLVVGQIFFMSAAFYLALKAADSDDGFRGWIEEIKEDIIITGEKVAKLVNPNYKDRDDIWIDKIRSSNEKWVKRIEGSAQKTSQSMNAAQAESLEKAYADGVDKTQGNKQQSNQINEATVRGMKA